MSDPYESSFRDYTLCNKRNRVVFACSTQVPPSSVVRAVRFPNCSSVQYSNIRTTRVIWPVRVRQDGVCTAVCKTFWTLFVINRKKEKITVTKLGGRSRKTYMHVIGGGTCYRTVSFKSYRRFDNPQIYVLSYRLDPTEII